MSNRIDLTQFEEITQGTWEVIELPGGGIDIGVRYTNNGHKPVVNFTQRMGEQVKQIERDVADMNAIAAVPNLIAELKRCYERIDELVDILSLLEDRQGVEIPCTHGWQIEDEHYTYQGVEWITRYVYCEYCGDENHDLSFDQTVEDFQKSSE